MYVLLSYVFYTYSELSIKTALQILQYLRLERGGGISNFRNVLQ